MADLVKLTAPNGSTVNVSPERAERLLLEVGYTKAESKKSTASRSSSSKSSK